MTTLLTADEVGQRISEQRRRVVGGSEPPPDPAVAAGGSTPPPPSLAVGAGHEPPLASESTPAPTFRYVRPLSDHAEYLIEAVQNVEGRYMFGLPEIDSRTRGIGKGELCLIVGYSFVGKSQLFLTSLLHNRDRRIVLFTPDETAEQVLVKLACMKTDTNAEHFEQRIRDNDTKTLARLRRMARDHFSNLLVIDDAIHLTDMTVALGEAERYWGDPVDAVGVDYLNMLRVDATTTDIEGKAEALKQWTKDNKLPVICVHQGGRGATAAGQVITMHSGKYGGEQEANFVIGVRRKRDDTSLEGYERERAADTVSISVVKNKRPPCRLTVPEGVDHHLSANSGRIVPMWADVPPREPDPQLVM